MEIDTGFLSAAELEGLEKEKRFYNQVIGNAFNVDGYLEIFDLKDKIHNALQYVESLIKDDAASNQLEAILITLVNSFQFKEVERTFNNKQLSKEIFKLFNDRFSNQEIILTNLGYDPFNRLMKINVKSKVNFELTLDYNKNDDSLIQVILVGEPL